MAEVAAHLDAAWQHCDLQQDFLGRPLLPVIVGVYKYRPAVVPVAFFVAHQNGHAPGNCRLSRQIERGMQLVRDAAQMLALQKVVECRGCYGRQDAENGKRG
ncbi:hypothetical protein D3C78_1625690 [compost metagenome]